MICCQLNKILSTWMLKMRSGLVNFIKNENRTSPEVLWTCRLYVDFPSYAGECGNWTETMYYASIDGHGYIQHPENHENDHRGGSVSGPCRHLFFPPLLVNVGSDGTIITIYYFTLCCVFHLLWSFCCVLNKNHINDDSTKY